MQKSRVVAKVILNVEDICPFKACCGPHRGCNVTFRERKSPLTTKERGSVPRRFSRMYSSRFHPENYPVDIHRKLALRMIWLSRPTTVPAELLPLCCRAPKVEEHILHKPQREHALLPRSLPFSQSDRL